MSDFFQQFFIQNENDISIPEKTTNNTITEFDETVSIEEEVENIYTSSFLKNIDTSEDEGDRASINADDLPSNMSGSEIEINISRLSSKSNSFEIDENDLISQNDDTPINSTDSIEMNTQLEAVKICKNEPEIKIKKEEQQAESVAATTASSLSPEQQLKIQRNKQLALQRRKNKNNATKL